METNREVAWREPPAAGLAACLYRSMDMMHCSHKDKNMRSCEQYITLLQAQQSAVRGSLNPNGSAHTFFVASHIENPKKVLLKIMFAEAKVRKKCDAE